MDEINYDPKNIFDANKSAIKRAFKGAEEFIDIALDDKPRKIKDINLGNARFPVLFFHMVFHTMQVFTIQYY